MTENVLEIIVDELDPIKDFNRRQLKNIINISIAEALQEHKRNVVKTGFGYLKSIFRGAIIGGIAGGIYGLITGESTRENLVYGATMGLILDSHQFLIRSAINYVRVQDFND